MAVRRPWIEGLRPVSGSGRLLGLRWLLWIVAAAPGLALSLGGLGEGIADRPYFSEAPDPMPLFPLIRMLGEMPGAIWGGLALAAAGCWLANLWLTAGAVALFDPRRQGPPKLWRTVWDNGTRALWAYLRIALLALLFAAVGARLLGLVAERIQEHGAVTGWTLRAVFLLQMGRGLALVCWLTLVGVFVWWCRVIVVADDRRRVRRLLSVVPRLWWRRPIRGLALHFLLALGSLLASSAVLFAWRQSAAGPLGWVVLWLLVLAVLAFVWHWRLRACRLLWASPDLGDLRAVPDDPWRIFRRLRGRLGALRRPARTAPAPAVPEEH